MAYNVLLIHRALASLSDSITLFFKPSDRRPVLFNFAGSSSVNDASLQDSDVDTNDLHQSASSRKR